MKQIITIILALLLLLLTGCRSEEQELVSPVSYYYLSEPVTALPEQDIIVAEQRETVQFAGSNTMKPLLDDYLSGPVAINYQSPFPRDTTIQEIKFAEHTVSVILSEEFAKLSGINLSVACACLTKTLMELTGVTVVTISVSETTLDGKEAITMYADQLHFQLPAVETNN